VFYNNNIFLLQSLERDKVTTPKTSKILKKMFALRDKLNAMIEREQAIEWINEQMDVFGITPDNLRKKYTFSKKEIVKKPKDILSEFMDSADKRPGHRLGSHHDEKSKDKISYKHSFKTVSNETKQKLGFNRIGKKLSEETTEKRLVTLRKRVAEGAETLISKQPVMIDGVRYQSLAEAAKTFCINPTTVINRCRNLRPQFSKWKLIPFKQLKQKS